VIPLFVLTGDGALEIVTAGSELDREAGGRAICLTGSASPRSDPLAWAERIRTRDRRGGRLVPARKPIVGTPAMHRVMRRWPADLAHDAYRDSL
jgi:hypothetical protein